MPTGDDFNPFQLAAKAWPILTQRAKEKRPIEYGELAKAIGIHHRPVKYVLSKIQDYCLREKLPPLTILVEDQKGNVGKGFIAWDADDLESGRAKVYGEAWGNRPNPFTFAQTGATPDSIAESIATRRITPRDAYALVRQRGPAQDIFRRALHRVYGGQCAFSGHGGKPLLQAAHIIPWGKATPEQRLDPKNGLLLTVIQHRMFDLDWIRIDDDYRMRLNHDTISEHLLTASQQAELRSMDGQKIRLPADKNHWPSKAFLARRRDDPKLLREIRAELDRD